MCVCVCVCVSCSRRLAGQGSRGKCVCVCVCVSCLGQGVSVCMYGMGLTKLIHTPQITNECLAVPQNNQYSLCTVLIYIIFMYSCHSLSISCTRLAVPGKYVPRPSALLLVGPVESSVIS